MLKIEDYNLEDAIESYKRNNYIQIGYKTPSGIVALLKRIGSGHSYSDNYGFVYINSTGEPTYKTPYIEDSVKIAFKSKTLYLLKSIEELKNFFCNRKTVEKELSEVSKEELKEDTTKSVSPNSLILIKYKTL